MAGLLLDTCACLWLMAGAKLSDDSLAAMRRALENGEALFVSPISAWEVALKVAHRKLNIASPVRSWFDNLLASPGVALAALSPAILIESTELPEGIEKDPADRIIAATARDLGLIVVTRDRPLLNYAALGHIRAVRC